MISQIKTGSAVLQDKNFFRGGERSVDTHPDSTETRTGQQRNNDIHIVGQAGRDPIVLANVQCMENCCGPGNLLMQLAITVTGTATDQSKPVGVTAQLAIQNRANGLGTIARQWQFDGRLEQAMGSVVKHAAA
jgi:hypothetical protein